MVFSGRSRPASAAGREEKDVLAAAKTWLTGGGFQAALGSDGTFEKKIKR